MIKLNKKKPSVSEPKKGSAAHAELLKIREILSELKENAEDYDFFAAIGSKEYPDVGAEADSVGENKYLNEHTKLHKEWAKEHGFQEWGKKAYRLNALIKIANELDQKGLVKEADDLDKIIIKFAEEESFKTIGNPEEKIKELFGRNLLIFTHATQAINKNNFQGYLAQGHRIHGNNLGHTFAIVDSFESMIEKFLPPYNQLAQYGSNVIIMGINTRLGTMDTAGIVDPRFDPSDALTWTGGMFHGDIFPPTPVRWAGIFKGEEYEDEWYGTKNLIDSKFVFGLWEFENKVLHLNPNFEPNEPTSSGAEYIRNYQIAKEKMEDPEFIEKAKQIRESEFAKIEPVSSPIISSEEETEDDDDVF